MGSAHLSFAQRLHGANEWPSHLLVTDMMDLSRLRGLCPELANSHCTLLMHENQLSYPRPAADREDLHLGLININSCLAADRIWWNSCHHRDEFLQHLEKLSAALPEQGLEGLAHEILIRGQVLGLPLDLEEFTRFRREDRAPGPLRIAWNHRRDQDKGAAEVLHLLADLADEGLDFELMLFGERFRRQPEGIDHGLVRLEARVIHDHYVPVRSDYLDRLAQADVLLSTSKQENFGLSVAEGVQLGLWPLLPNGLCYPEFIPKAHHGDCLYQDARELKALIVAAASQPHRRAGTWYDPFEARELLAPLFSATSQPG
ncbi:MAG: hypothetical protein CMH55_02855 [Myxococcales bacterium]|nr:hypothetical protein [Myxococcales bacterium]